MASSHDGPDNPGEGRIWQIRLTKTAKQMLREITDRRIVKKIVETIDRLKYEPEKQGTPLVDDLIGYRKVRAVGQRYRVIYTIEEDVVTVFVVAVGLRKEGSKDDVYALAKKLLRRGLLEPTQEDQGT
ncbi:MAG: type II toxin-antitoxin system RelE/ParE family toxin [Chloroflexota bacterium]|nr:type II toxin-antitoxin system RelE/ParE family toxin [Chloroflexota bacterium]MDQ5864843.1 type II toxin-antitoxin system RelE/ParE family toxin [Chloroflexota bacterium]